ncbi:MAG: HAMP domain-containing protein [Rhodospirillaceae bacterium]|jgi:methyl-accepting chemotaxis protein|nr:HAMP domain-containing protein [Rhodospirillaceae bacterium]
MAILPAKISLRSVRRISKRKQKESIVMNPDDQNQTADDAAPTDSDDNVAPKTSVKLNSTTNAGSRQNLLRNSGIGKRIWSIVGIAAAGVIGLGITSAVFQSKFDANQTQLDSYTSIASLISKLEINALQMRRSEKDFLLRRLPKYRGKYLKAAKHGQAVLGEIRQVPAAKGVDGASQKLSAGVKTHIAQFETVFNLQKTLGFNEKSGLQGALRKAVHGVETYLKKVKLDNLTVKMLMMRRHEKDFIMRGAQKYVARIDKRQAEFRSLLAASTLPPATQKAINGLLNDYVGKFKNFAETSLILKKETKKLSSIFAAMGPSFKKVTVFSQTRLTEARATYEQAKSTLSRTLIGLTIGILIVSIFVGFFIARSIVSPVQILSGAVSRLADGDTDVEIVGTEFRDETGTMAKALEVFRGNLIEAKKLESQQRDAENKAQAEERRHEAEKQEASGKEAERKEREAAEQHKRTEQIEKIIASFDTQISSVVETLSSATTEMQSSAETMSATAEQTNKQATAVAAASEKASVNVQTVASSTEELSASVEEISRQVTQSNEIAQNAVNEAKQTNEKVEGLAEAAQRIGDVVNLINDIASQTNLLALNATIEAARAGDAGKGFAVVASEVKSLATQTGKATEEIAAQITAIQNATNDAVQAIQGIGSTIGHLGEIATSVASAVDQQGSATREIATSVQQAAAGTQEVSNNITQVTQAASESQSSSTQMLSASKELALQGDVLRGEVDKFLQEIRAA